MYTALLLELVGEADGHRIAVGSLSGGLSFVGLLRTALEPAPIYGQTASTTS
jgi:hypothetical protein